MSTVEESSTTMLPAGRLAEADAEYRTLMRLAELVRAHTASAPPIDALQLVVDLTRELTGARYAALAVTDEKENTEGFVTSGLTRSELRGLRAPPQAHGPLRGLRREGEPIRIDNLEADATSFGFPPRHPHMKSLLGVQLWAHQRVRGSLYISEKTNGQPFEHDDETILLVLARHASQIIERDWY